jgi:signal transduction histidine kinase
MSGDLCRDLDGDGFDLAVVGPMRSRVASLLEMLDPADKPVLLVWKEKQAAEEARRNQLGVRLLKQQEGWLDALVLVSSETLRLAEATARARSAEEAGKTLQAQAMLGRYMLDERHTLNNSLTSVLGNSELLLLDPGSLSPSARSQVETIRNMAVRIHEILQRFSSIEKELNAVEKQAENEARTRVRVAGAGL